MREDTGLASPCLKLSDIFYNNLLHRQPSKRPYGGRWPRHAFVSPPLRAHNPLPPPFLHPSHCRLLSLLQRHSNGRKGELRCASRHERERGSFGLRLWRVDCSGAFFTSTVNNNTAWSCFAPCTTAFQTVAPVCTLYNQALCSTQVTRLLHDAYAT